jgi:hypothetical protein
MPACCQGVAAVDEVKSPLAPKPGKSLLKARVVGSGSAVPAQVITNGDIAAMGLDTSDEWISSRTGIQQRFAGRWGEPLLPGAKILADPRLALQPMPAKCSTPSEHLPSLTPHSSPTPSPPPQSRYLPRHVLDGATSLKSIASAAAKDALANAGVDPLSVNHTQNHKPRPE